MKNAIKLKINENNSCYIKIIYLDSENFARKNTHTYITHCKDTNFF